MKSALEVFKRLSGARWAALVGLIGAVAGAAALGFYVINLNIGVHAWMTAQRIWKNHRQRLVECARETVRSGQPSRMEVCRSSEQFFEAHRRLFRLADHPELDVTLKAIRDVELSASEADAAADLFDVSRWMPKIAQATEVWGGAIAGIDDLDMLVDQCRRDLRMSPLGEQRRRHYIRRIDRVEVRLENRERRFNQVLQQASRMTRFVGWTSLAAALVMLLGIGASLWRAARRFELERDDAEKQLLRRDRSYKALVQNLREAVCAVDPDTGRVNEANAAFWEIVGRRPDDSGQLFVHDFLEAPAESIEAYLGDIADESRREETWKTPTGATHTMQMTAYHAPLEGADTYILARDVTELREYEASMVELDRMIAVGTLAAGVGHEINNPLAYVAGGIDFASRQLRASMDADGGVHAGDLAATVADVLDALDDAREGAQRVRDIAGDLRTFSRRGEVDAVGAVEVEPIMELALDMAAHELRDGVDVTREYGPDSVVLANESRLAQVFLNLVINAAYAVKQAGGQDHQIGVHARRQDDEVVIEVHDTGTGIALDEQNAVFEPFRTTKPVGQGTGLGLPISRNIVESLGGTITFESTPGVETTFRVCLPAGQLPG